MVQETLTTIALTAPAMAAALAAMMWRWSADRASRVAAIVTGLGGISALALVIPGAQPTPTLAPTSDWPLLRIDPLAILMLVLVLGLSCVIQLFASRYLRGDSRQRWFVVFANLVTATTALMVSAGTVLMFVFAWIAAGITLVALLATYSHLAQARDGVKRTLIRLTIADVALVAAAVGITVSAGGDVALNQISDVVVDLPAPLTTLFALLLVVPALARSSQVPFHGWLPSTLTTPTPVSALMHAGIINAGAILIIRFTPVVTASPAAMALLFGAGALTLIYASVVRMVKADVKGRLVFSTMAQMGFMMLACGMGAFAAAVFHLVAHGLFKSALFLRAGSGVHSEAQRRAWPPPAPQSPGQRVLGIGVAIAVPIAAITAARVTLETELSASSQALQAFVVFTGALALGAALWTRLSAATLLVGTGAVTALAFGYSFIIGVFDSTLQLPPAAHATSPAWLAVPAVALIALQVMTMRRSGGALSARLYALTLAAAVQRAIPTRTPAPAPAPAEKGQSR